MRPVRPRGVDVDRLWFWFERAIAGDTGARVGENRVEPDDSRVAAFATDVIEPALAGLGADVERDALNNVTGRFGPDSGRELLFVAYPVSHHGNEMADPLRARRTTVQGDEVWVGQDASEGKGGLVALLGAVDALRRRGDRLAALPLDARPHPRLGDRAVTPYKLMCGPVAPHTIPAWCELTLDRRLLAGESPTGAVAAGAERAHRSPHDVDRCVGVVANLGDDEEAAYRGVKLLVVAIHQNGGAHALQRVGIDIDPPPVVAGVYPDMSHAEDWDAATAVAEQWVSDGMARRYADTFCAVGSAANCATRLQQAAEIGATSLYVRHLESYTLPHDLIARFATEVIPRLRNPA